MQRKNLRTTLSSWANNYWFLFADDVLFVSLFGVSAYIFSRSWEPLYLLSALAFIGSACMYAMFHDLESQITVVMLFFSAFVVSGVNETVGALILAIPVGLVVSLAVAGWMDQPNRQRGQHPLRPAAREAPPEITERRRHTCYEPAEGD